MATKPMQPTLRAQHPALEPCFALDPPVPPAILRRVRRHLASATPPSVRTLLDQPMADRLELLRRSVPDVVSAFARGCPIASHHLVAVVQLALEHPEVEASRTVLRAVRRHSLRWARALVHETDSVRLVGGLLALTAGLDALDGRDRARTVVLVARAAAQVDDVVQVLAVAASLDLEPGSPLALLVEGMLAGARLR